MKNMKSGNPQNNMSKKAKNTTPIQASGKVVARTKRTPEQSAKLNEQEVKIKEYSKMIREWKKNIPIYVKQKGMNGEGILPNPFE